MNSPTEVIVVLHDPRGRDEEYWEAIVSSVVESWEVEVITIEVQ